MASGTQREIRWEHFKEALAQVSSLTSTLAVVNFSLVIYLSHTKHIVIGVPDDFVIFGIRISINEVGFAVILVFLLQLLILRNILLIANFIRENEDKHIEAKSMVCEKPLIFNPFFYQSKTLGVAISVVNLIAYVFTFFGLVSNVLAQALFRGHSPLATVTVASISLCLLFSFCSLGARIAYSLWSPCFARNVVVLIVASFLIEVGIMSMIPKA